MPQDTQETDWIEWQGGECPVDRNTMVDIRFAPSKCGRQYADKLRADPTNWVWQHGKAPLDIAFYRVSA